MAKKSYKLHLKIDVSFDIQVPPEFMDSYLNAEKKKKLCLTAKIIYGGGITSMYNIYHDHIVGEGLKFGPVTNNTVRVDASGLVEKKLSVKDDEDFIAFLTENTSCNIISTGFYDNNLNNYYVDGLEDKEVIIGVGVLA